MRKTFIALSLAATGLTGYAQQDAQFSQNMFNKLAINPGYAGSSGMLCGTLLYRTQWVGFAGAPKTGLLSVDMPVKMLYGGVGLTVFSDELGAEKNFSAKLAYAYRKSIGTGSIGVGIELGIFSKSLLGLSPTGNTEDGLVPIQSNDPSIPVNGHNDMTFDFGFGLYYNTKDLYFGISTTHIPETDIKFNDSTLISISLARHYYILAGYDYQLPNPSLVLRPSVFIKTDAATTALDLNLLVEWNSQVWLGPSYRPGDAIVAILGVQILKDQKRDLKFGYSYDITTSEIKGYSSGTHEVMLRYCHKVGPSETPMQYRNVRFL